MKNLLLFVIVLCLNQTTLCARILGIISIPSYSHQVWLQPLWKELSLRGHQVTVLTTNPINDRSLTNLTEIDTSISHHALTDNLQEIINTKNPFKMIDLSLRSFSNAFNKQLEHSQVKQLITDPKVDFDLLITEVYVPASMAFSKRFNCPVIGVVATEAPNLLYKMHGNPVHPVVSPNVLLGEEIGSSLKNRVLNVLLDCVEEWILNYFYMPIQEEIVENHFGSEYNLAELSQSVSLYFVNADPIFHLVRPLLPTIIQIGERSMRLPMKPLPKNLQKVLDEASGGFIYFSLGSNANSKDLSSNTISVILETFKELPYTILWKYESEKLLNKPENVIVSKWIPQIEVLNHVNIKLFITHGGYQSIQEALSARVPMLGMPIFADQPIGMSKIVKRGCALSVDYRHLEKNHFKATILEMVHNPIYRNRIRKLTTLAEDQPLTGLQRAIWWTEYVLRHNGTRHLRSPVLDIPWYQHYLLDVAIVFLLVFAVAIYVFVFILKCSYQVIKYLTRKNSKTKND